MLNSTVDIRHNFICNKTRNADTELGSDNTCQKIVG
jgi:hypothetical protein